MIWTEGWYHAEHEQPGCWAWSMSIEEHSDSRWAILWRYRLALARAEVAAFKARLERVGADTTGGGVEFVKFEVLAASMKRVSELEAMYETSHASRMHAEDCVRRLEAENAKLRKCVEAADDFVETVIAIETSQAMHRVYSVALAHGAPYNGMDWSKQLSTYRAARAEVKP